jgi:hypothetical protein
MNRKQRIRQLESLLGTRRGVLIVVHSKNGRVTSGRFTGMRLEEVEKRFADNDILLNVVRSSDPKQSGDTIT